MMKKRHLTGFIALGATAALALSGCSSDGGDAGGDNGDTGSGDGEAMGTITLGFLPAWTDGLSTAWLLEDQLTKLGYTVEMTDLTEAGPLYTALAQGDVDIYPSAWPELTHAEYMNEYGDDIEDLGTYYDNAKLTIAVPSYSQFDSIEDLKGNGDLLDGRIVGIEPGAGLTAQTQDSMIPTYELGDEFELVTSSTAGMLTELDTAIQNEEEIVVTLWRPFWANDTYDVKDLEDPEGAMGEPEGLHFLGTSGFAEANPEAAELIAGIKLDDAQYAALEDTVVNEYEGEDDKSAAIDEWIEANPEAFDTLVTE